MCVGDHEFVLVYELLGFLVGYVGFGGCGRGCSVSGSVGGVRSVGTI